jgi:hypothetical protein
MDLEENLVVGRMGGLDAWEDLMPGRTQIAQRQSNDMEINMMKIVVRCKYVAHSIGRLTHIGQ